VEASTAWQSHRLQGQRPQLPRVPQYEIHFRTLFDEYGWVKSFDVFGMMVLKVQHEVALAEHRLLARSKRFANLWFYF